MRVLVTDGDNRAALAVTRSLGAARHDVVVADWRPRSLAGASRYCAGTAVYPDPTHDEEGFIAALRSIVALRRIDVLLPIADVTTAVVVAHRALFEPSCAVPLASAVGIARAADKVDVLRTAERLGVPIPRTVMVPDSTAAGQFMNSLPFPVVVKPRRSRIRTDAGWAACSVSYAEDAAALRARIAECPKEAFPLILQERIDGPGLGVFMCYAGGSIVAEFSHRRLREKPPSGGVSVLSESVAMDPAARQYSRALLDDLGWNGVAMVEFKVDLRDGQPKLMEINGRFWGSLQLAIDAGVDFPAILIETIGARTGRTRPTYKVGVRSRWLWGDFDALLLRLLSRGPVNNTTPNRARAVTDFLKLWGKGLRYENPRVSDLWPWVHETAQWLRRVSRGSERA